MSDKDIIYRQAAVDELIKMLVDCFQADEELVDAVATTIKDLPSAQPEIKCIANIALTDEQVKEAFEKAKCDILAARSRSQWIPVKMRPMDSEEREYWEEQFGEELADEDAVMFDCPMPDDGQEILVSYRKWISIDKCEIDGGCYGLEGNGDWEDVIAWMPLPEPYQEKGGKNNGDC